MEGKNIIITITNQYLQNDLDYLSGIGNHLSLEAIARALPLPITSLLSVPMVCTPSRSPAPSSPLLANSTSEELANFPVFSRIEERELGA
ncbi:hypothetical protein LguiB_025103 [Lonicera macranthoides]